MVIRNAAKQAVDLTRILANPETAEFRALRDRAAYVFVTGAFPSHLRTPMTSLLVALTYYSIKPVSLDGRGGPIAIEKENIERLALTEHPMIREVQEYTDQGYKIQRTPRSIKDRRPYSRVYLFREANNVVERVTVQIDGSVKRGWA